MSHISTKFTAGVIFILTGLLFASCKQHAATTTDYFNGKELFQTVEKYVALGEHRTGTPTDTATSFWLNQELKSYGYDVKYLEFPIRQFFPGKVFLANEKDTVKAFPLWWLNEKISNTVKGSLIDIRDAKQYKKGDIVLLHFPITHIKHGDTDKYLDSLINLGVGGIVAVTENPSGEIEAYNTSKDQQPWKVPVILVAPKDTSSVLSLVKKTVTLSINGEFKDVKGRNVYGTIGNGDQYVVVSTPISGWFTCGGERGSGLAIWLSLAKWAATEKSKYTFVFTGNSGHEHAFLGAHHYLEHDAPSPDKTHLWIHFGAGAATLQWISTDSGLVKQTNVDPGRKFFFNDAVSTSFNNAFKNINAEKILANDNPGGELAYVARKGYKRYAGVAYGHPFFHVKTDDANTTSPEILEATARAFKDFLSEEIK